MKNKSAKPLVKFFSKVVLTVAIILIVIFAGQTAFNLGVNLIGNRNQNQEAKDVTIEIPAGASTSMIADILQENGVISSALMFKISAKMDGYDGKFKYGTYNLNTSIDEDVLMKTLSTEGAQAKEQKITFPEGYSVYQMAKKLDEQNIVKEQDFLDAADSLDYDYPFIKEIPTERVDGEAIALEGYLFPDTYNIGDNFTAKDIVNMMLRRFNDIFINNYYARASELGMSVDQVITVASIVEKEAKLASDRAKVSSVIYNRSDIDMKLQMCSTVLYAEGRVGEPVQKLYYEDLEFESPYNTYKYAGLPYGPIANPGKASLEAALFPDETKYLYFVLINEATGEHHFSTTLDEHNAYKNQ